MSDDDLIDRFVEAFYLDEISIYDPPPPDCMAAGINPLDWEYVLWRPAKIEAPEEQRERIRNLRLALQTKPPPLYEKLVSRWSWLSVSIGRVELFPCPNEEPLTSLTERMLKDPIFGSDLMTKRKIIFGIVTEQSFDPVCFDTAKKLADGDCPVVTFEHRAMMTVGHIGESKTLWPSCRTMMQSVVAARNSSKSR